jgi:membrane complex biogenesis BtpA family protein
MSTWLRELFGTATPIIAMAHLPPLPGTPLYDERRGPDWIVESVRADVAKLTRNGMDAVLFCNEGDRPYSLKADFEGAAMLARVVAECRPTDRPFGVDFLWDARCALAVAACSGAAFIREVLTGAYDSDMGLWNPDAAGLLRYRRQLGANGVKVFFNVTPEFASPLGRRTVAQVARSAVVSSLADVILVSGPMAGAEPDLAVLEEARGAVPPEVPVLLNTGAKVTNIRQFLRVADGAIVGSSLKVDGYTWNPVDEARVRAFMAAVHDARQEAAGG